MSDIKKEQGFRQVFVLRTVVILTAFIVIRSMMVTIACLLKLHVNALIGSLRMFQKI